MAVVFKRISYKPPDSETPVLLDRVINTQSARGLDINTARSEITLDIKRDTHVRDGVSMFQEDGLLEIYVDYNPIVGAVEQLLISGQVREVKWSITNNARQVKLGVADRTVRLLNNIWNATYENQPVNQIVANIVEQASGNTIDTSLVTSLNTSGSSFPSITYAKPNTPAFEMIKELSRADFVGEDRNYIFYVDQQNRLRWFYPSQDVDDTITEGNPELLSVTFDRNNDNVINFVIFNAGADLRGNGVAYYHYNNDSTTAEIKGRYFPMINLSQVLFDAEKTEGNLVESTTGTIPYKGLLYESTFPLTTSWGVEVADLPEYNIAFREELRARGIKEAEAITTRFGKLLMKGKLDLKGSNAYFAGDLLRVIFPSLGINQLLRVHDVSHGIGTDGWVTTLQLEEDEVAVAAEEQS